MSNCSAARYFPGETGVGGNLVCTDHSRSALVMGVVHAVYEGLRLGHSRFNTRDCWCSLFESELLYLWLH